MVGIGFHPPPLDVLAIRKTRIIAARNTFDVLISNSSYGSIGTFPHKLFANLRNINLSLLNVIL
jgi:hypothetical protein